MSTEEYYERSKRYAEGYHYVALKKPDASEAEKKEFAERYADKYRADGGI